MFATCTCNVILSLYEKDRGKQNEDREEEGKEEEGESQRNRSGEEEKIKRK